MKWLQYASPSIKNDARQNQSCFIESLNTENYLLVYLEGHAKCSYDVVVLLQIHVHHERQNEIEKRNCKHTAYVTTVRMNIQTVETWAMLWHRAECIYV
jgi:hypothetical protein